MFGSEPRPGRARGGSGHAGPSGVRRPRSRRRRRFRSGGVPVPPSGSFGSPQRRAAMTPAPSPTPHTCTFFGITLPLHRRIDRSRLGLCHPARAEGRTRGSPGPGPPVGEWGAGACLGNRALRWARPDRSWVWGMPSPESSARLVCVEADEADGGRLRPRPWEGGGSAGCCAPPHTHTRPRAQSLFAPSGKRTRLGAMPARATKQALRAAA